MVPSDPELKVDDEGELMFVKRKGQDDVPAILSSGEVVLTREAVKKAGPKIKEILKEEGIELPNFAKGGKVKRRAKPKAKPEEAIIKNVGRQLQKGRGPKAQSQAQATGNIVIIGDISKPRRRAAPRRKKAENEVKTGNPPKPPQPPRYISNGYLMPPTINVKIDNPFRGQAVQASAPVVVPQAVGPRPAVAALDSVGASSPVPTIAVSDMSERSLDLEDARRRAEEARQRALEEREIMRHAEAERARAAGASSPARSAVAEGSLIDFGNGYYGTSPPLSWFDDGIVSLPSYAFRPIHSEAGSSPAPSAGAGAIPRPSTAVSVMPPASEAEPALAPDMSVHFERPSSVAPSDAGMSIFTRPMVGPAAAAAVPAPVTTLEDLVRPPIPQVTERLKDEESESDEEPPSKPKKERKEPEAMSETADKSSKKEQEVMRLITLFQKDADEAGQPVVSYPDGVGVGKNNARRDFMVDNRKFYGFEEGLTQAAVRKLVDTEAKRLKIFKERQAQGLPLLPRLRERGQLAIDKMLKKVPKKKGGEESEEGKRDE